MRRNNRNKNSLPVGYFDGGDILKYGSQLAPLLNLAVPGLGSVVGMGMNMGSQAIDAQEAKRKAAMMAVASPTNYQNSNAFGYDDGGWITEQLPMLQPELFGTTNTTYATEENMAKMQALLQQALMQQAKQYGQSNNKKSVKRTSGNNKSSSQESISNAETIRKQRILKEAGYDIGAYGKNKDGIDGIMGKKTQAAWNDYQKKLAYETRNSKSDIPAEKTARINESNFKKSARVDVVSAEKDNFLTSLIAASQNNKSNNAYFDKSKYAKRNTGVDQFGNTVYSDNLIFNREIRPEGKGKYVILKDKEGNEYARKANGRYVKAPNGKFAYDNGGDLSQLNQSSYDVNANPNEVDPMQLNYKGQDIRIGNNEVLDAGNDRVISENFYNPLTGKKIVDEYRKVEKQIGKAEKQSGDLASNNSVKFLNLIKDNLFNMQESVKSALTPQNQNIQPNGQGYDNGGLLNIANNVRMGMANPKLLPPAQQAQWLKQHGFSSIQDYEYMTMQDDPTALLAPRLSLDQAGALAGFNPNQMKLMKQSIVGADELSTLSPMQRKALEAQMDLANKAGLDNQIGKIKSEMTNQPRANKAGYFDNWTQGEKIMGATNAAALLAQGIEAFRPVDKEKYRYNTSPISHTQMNVNQPLYNNQQSYLNGLASLSGATNSANRQAAMQAMFANKLQADNQVMGQYGNQNAQLTNQYEDRLANRRQQEIGMQMQVDDLNQRNDAARAGMRQNLYSSVANFGQSLGNMQNSKLSNQMALDNFKLLAPDVWQNYLKNQQQLNKLGG